MGALYGGGFGFLRACVFVLRTRRLKGRDEAGFVLGLKEGRPAASEGWLLFCFALHFFVDANKRGLYFWGMTKMSNNFRSFRWWRS
jgi:hypothetical protein